MTPRSVCDFFWEEVNKYDSKEDMPPIVATSKYYLMSACRENNFLLATCTAETPPLVGIEFLHRVFDIFCEYFGDVEETTIKENFATVYQLLEEMMDYGMYGVRFFSQLFIYIKKNSSSCCILFKFPCLEFSVMCRLPLDNGTKRSESYD